MAKRWVLSEELLAQARARALAAGPLPEEVRRRVAALWAVQGDDRAVLRMVLADQVAAPSWWVVTYLAPKLADHLATAERLVGKEVSLAAADDLQGIGQMLRKADVSKALEALLTSQLQGPGSRTARQGVAAVLRTLDLGLMGTEVVAALYARTFGLDDLACDLVSDGMLDSAQAEHAAQLAQDEQSTGSPGDSEPLVLYRELLPDDVHAARVEQVPTARGAADHDVVDQESQ